MEENTFSVTLRPRGGLNLGLKSTTHFIEELMRNREAIVSIEGFGETCHLQCGIVTSDPAIIKRPDNYKRKLLTILGITDPSEKKYALCVKPHESWQLLVQYCYKEGEVLHEKVTSVDRHRVDCFSAIYEDFDDYLYEAQAQGFQVPYTWCRYEFHDVRDKRTGIVKSVKKPPPTFTQKCQVLTDFLFDDVRERAVAQVAPPHP